MTEKRRPADSMVDVIDATVGVEMKKLAQEIRQCRVLKGKAFLLAEKNLSEEAFRTWAEETLGSTMDEARGDMRFAEEIARRSEN